ncbi:MAG TPA: hypothetical protein VD833_15670 [Vicinamibacterales bacterium]|nr:hypothetical protein [Vicinamibacterales bacterium]
MRATDQLALLKEFHRDRLAMLKRHIAAARHISHYDFNNTYQYVIAREEVHVRWLVDAIVEAGAEPEDVPEPSISVRGKGDAAQTALLTEDRDAAGAFLEKWRSRVETLTNARHRTMLRVVLGETVEHKRFFEQALAGRTDLLGRRADGAGTGGGVLPNRWIG